MEFIFDDSIALHKVMFTLLWSLLSTKRTQLSSNEVWSNFLIVPTDFYAPILLSLPTVFSQNQKKIKPTTTAVFANLDRMCSVIYSSRPAIRELSLAIVESLFKPIQIWHLLAGLFLHHIQSEIVTRNLVFKQLHKWFSNVFRKKEFRDFSCSPDSAC